MKTMIASMVAVTGLMIAGSVMAADMPDLAKKTGCVACHTIDKKLVGPAWQEVANKYKGQADAVASLSDKILKGGKGVWGVIPMPPQPKVSAGDAKEMAEFIMGLAK